MITCYASGGLWKLRIRLQRVISGLIASIGDFVLHPDETWNRPTAWRSATG